MEILPEENNEAESNYYDVFMPNQNIITFIIYSSVLIFFGGIAYEFSDFILIIIRYTIVTLLILFITYNIFKGAVNCETSPISTSYKNGAKRVIRFGDSVIPTVKKTLFDNFIQTRTSNDEIQKTITTNDRLVDTMDNIRGDDTDSKYCLVNKTGGTRNCMKVDRNSKCLSGEIFPSIDICINPNIRK